MSRRILALIFAATTLASTAAPAFAQSHIIAQLSSKPSSSEVYLGHVLTPGHRYHIDVISSGHYKYRALRSETYVIIANGRVSSQTHSSSFSGMTSSSVSVTSPRIRGMSEWTLIVTVLLSSRHKVTVRFVDLGKQK